MKSLFALSLLCASFAVALSDGIVLCYYGSWANARPGLGSFGVSDIPVDLCTHVVYSFIGLTENGTLTAPDQTVVNGKSNVISDLVGLKNQNPELKVLVAIGGWSEGSEDFSTVTNSDTLRATFVQNLVEYIDSNGFDGLDLDWEYPAQRGGNETDKEAFVWLLQDLKSQFEPRGWLLTAAVAVTQYHIDLSYDVPGINDAVDFLHLMTYDYVGSWDSVTGIHAPLYEPVDGVISLLNVDTSVNVWLSNGASMSKMVLGLSAYGRSFMLASVQDNGIGAPSVGAGTAGPYTEETGVLSYYEVCMSQQENSNWTITEVEGYVYAQLDDFWIAYDNPNTIRNKAAYARNRDMAGVMFWAVDLDDFTGQCGESYDIIRTAATTFNSAAAFHITFGVLAAAVLAAFLH